MSTNHSGRVYFILFVLVLALIAVFWPAVTQPIKVGFNSDVPFSQKLNLKPGIDIAGGTSLLYEIKAPQGARNYSTLAEDVTKALKRRVDPHGVRNLIWRPQNPNKIEIQMPLSGTGEGARLRKELEDARAALEATNIRIPEAMAWVEEGEKRKPADVDRLAAGSADRKRILQELAKLHDVMAKKADPTDTNHYVELISEQNKAKAKFPELQGELNRTVLRVSDLERLLAKRDSDTRTATINAIKAKSENFPARKQALERYLDAYDKLQKAGGGLETAEDLKHLLSGAGVLEFHIVPQMQEAVDAHHKSYADYVRQLQVAGPRGDPSDQYRWFEVEDPTQQRGVPIQTIDETAYVLASVKPDESLDERSAGGEWKLIEARAASDPTSGDHVAFSFNPIGGRVFGDLTTKNRGRQMAIFLDGQLISAPNINSPITTGSGIITGGGPGGFNKKELDYLVTMLNAGALPAQLNSKPIFEETVGPQLGEDNLRRGLFACGMALVIVAIFLVGYYYTAGFVAFLGVLMNLVLILGAMAALHATFTLPGIAAIVLTVGSAVDANVLIFERLREEQHRGVGIRMAIRNAYDRAFSAILDSNMTTLITSAFLIIFGSEEVKGFGIALVIGILGSLFTSLFVTKTLFGILIDKFHVKQLGSLPLTFPKWDKMLKPHIRWTRLSVPFIIGSAIFIIVGCVLFANYAAKGQMLDIEFASGTAVKFELKEPAKQEEVRKWIDDEAKTKEGAAALPAAGVVRVGADGRTWEVATPNEHDDQVREAILRAVGDRLNTEQKILFEGVDFPATDIRLVGKDGTTAATEPAAASPATLPAALAATGPSTQPATAPASRPANGPIVVIPVTKDTLANSSMWPGGIVPEEAKRFTGGAAVILRGLPTSATPKQIADRMNSAKQQPRKADDPIARAVGIDFTVIPAPGVPNDKGWTALVFASDTARDYRVNQAAWRSDVVDPIWELARQSLNSESKFRQVKNVNASVAGETQKDATIALVLSLVFIMAYIWVRFGNLKYGTATVVALLHDVLFVIAALGYAHLLAGNALGDFLQVQPFRINLTIVAGVLTIMGYSMLDTIVVFDRIREIRGKYGHVSTTVINDAVNQTLSRTLLTAGTTVISVGLMYFLGGEGIHGFTFVLFLGILAGTYSSVAIASPILLIGGKKGTEEAPVRAPRGAATT
jgi:SecD/SecF fusion protein